MLSPVSALRSAPQSPAPPLHSPTHAQARRSSEPSSYTAASGATRRPAGTRLSPPSRQPPQTRHPETPSPAVNPRGPRRFLLSRAELRGDAALAALLRAHRVSDMRKGHLLQICRDLRYRSCIWCERGTGVAAQAGPGGGCFRAPAGAGHRPGSCRNRKGKDLLAPDTAPHAWRARRRRQRRASRVRLGGPLGAPLRQGQQQLTQAVCEVAAAGVADRAPLGSGSPSSSTAALAGLQSAAAAAADAAAMELQALQQPQQRGDGADAARSGVGGLGVPTPTSGAAFASALREAGGASSNASGADSEAVYQPSLGPSLVSAYSTPPAPSRLVWPLRIAATPNVRPAD